MGISNTMLDYMIEKENDRVWEEQNRPTDGETLRQAAKSMNYAIESLDETADLVNEACETLADCVEYDRVKSILNDMEETLERMKKMRDSWQKGES